MSDEIIMSENNNLNNTNISVKKIPDKDILLFKSCLVSVEYPGIESSTTFVFDKIGVDYFVSDKQTCCTGLGHYSDVFDQFTTTVIGARNFSLAKDMNRHNIVMLCATCYAINKKVANILNNATSNSLVVLDEISPNFFSISNSLFRLFEIAQPPNMQHNANKEYILIVFILPLQYLVKIYQNTLIFTIIFLKLKVKTFAFSIN